MNKIVLTLIAFFTMATLFSQETEKQNPRKIGLVLSGGGAKGFAHIGALKVIEEAGVKIDYIGGTSMGAVIGGLYASGYNASQIDSLFKDTNFTELISDFIPRSSKNFYEKRNDESYAIVLPFNKFKVEFPEALSKGMYSYNLISKATRNVRYINDFSKLPTPFFCMATDIETGNQVVLNKGNLALAILASSAFPTLFPPVEIDGKFLVDGGVTNNYPIDEMRAMGADIVIGVDVQNDLMERKELKDATKILVQITNLQTIKKMKANVEKTDVYIRPDVKDYGIVSFEKGKEIIRKGEEATFVVYETLEPLAQSPKYIKPKLKVVTDTLNIKKINTNQLEKYTPEYIYGKLRFKPGAKITYDYLIKGMNNLSATQNFGTINYALTKSGDGDDLNILLIENPIKTFLKLGIHYDGLYKSAVLLNVTRKNAFLKNDLLSADLIVGEDFRYNFDYYIETGFNISFGFKSRYNQFTVKQNTATSFFTEQNTTLSTYYIDYSDFSNQIFFQSLLYQKYLFGGGLNLQYLNIGTDPQPGYADTLDKSTYLSAFGYMKYDSYDNKYFPKKGWFLSADAQTYLFSSNYTGEFNPFSILKAEVGIAKTVFDKLTVKVVADAGLSLGNDSVHIFDFVLGGYGYKPINNFKPFYGYDFLSFGANSYIKTDITLDYEFYRKNHLNASANFANLENDLFQTLNWISSPEYSGYALGYGLETLIGPVEAKYSWSPEIRQNYFWVSVGFWF